jgi:hypothetical protein
LNPVGAGRESDDPAWDVETLQADLWLDR